MTDQEWREGLTVALQGIAYGIILIKDFVSGIVSRLNDNPLLTLSEVLFL